MAISEDQKEALFADYDTGDYSQRQLVEKHKISKGTVSRLLKGREAKNGALKKKAIANYIIEDDIKEQMGQLSGAENRALQNSIKSGYEKEKKSLTVVSNYQDLILEKQNSNMILIALLKEQRDLKMLETDDPAEAVQIFANYNTQIDVLIDTQEIRHGVEANDKMTITTGENERHAPKGDINLANQNVQNTRVEIVKRSDRG